MCLSKVVYQGNFMNVTKTKGRRIHLSFPKKIRTWLIDFQGNDLLNVWVYFQILSPPPPLSKKTSFLGRGAGEGKGESTRVRGSTVQRSVCQPRALQGRLKLHPFLSEKDNLGGSDKKKRECKKKTLIFNLNFSDYCTRMASPSPSIKKYMYKKWGGLCFQVSGS